MALVLPRVGNQAVIRVGGKLVLQIGTLGDTRINAAHSPVWLQLPEAMLSPVHTTPLEIEVTAQSGRWGGLAQIYYGSQATLHPYYEGHFKDKQYFNLASVIAMSLIGLLVTGLWWQTRDSFFGIFAVFALASIFRPLDYLLPEPPLPWPLWGAFVAMSFIVTYFFLLLFIVQVLSRPPRWVYAALWCYLYTACIAAFIAFYGRYPWLWTATVTSNFILSLSLVYLSYRALRYGALENKLLAAATLLILVVAARDLILTRLVSASVTYGYLPRALLVLMFIMLWIVVKRYALHMQNYRELNITLASRVAAREDELQVIHQQLMNERELQVTLQERERIMRDIHDGVGSQLVGLLSLIKKGDLKTTSLQTHVNAALDELRMAVDAMQPMNGDLATVLATLRFRLQPRLEAAGITMVWEVDELPQMTNLTSDMVLQIQRILLEAFTNILRHAQATQVVVKAYHQHTPAAWMLEISDNGVGLSNQASASNTVTGHGMRNMQTRAIAIGAALFVSINPDGGVMIRVILPFK